MSLNEEEVKAIHEQIAEGDLQSLTFKQPQFDDADAQQKLMFLSVAAHKGKQDILKFLIEDTGFDMSHPQIRLQVMVNAVGGGDVDTAKYVIDYCIANPNGGLPDFPGLARIASEYCQPNELLEMTELFADKLKEWDSKGDEFIRISRDQVFGAALSGLIMGDHPDRIKDLLDMRKNYDGVENDFLRYFIEQAREACRRKDYPYTLSDESLRHSIEELASYGVINSITSEDKGLVTAQLDYFLNRAHEAWLYLPDKKKETYPAFSALKQYSEHLGDIEAAVAGEDILKGEANKEVRRDLERFLEEKGKQGSYTVIEKTPKVASAPANEYGEVEGETLAPHEIERLRDAIRHGNIKPLLAYPKSIIEANKDIKTALISEAISSDQPGAIQYLIGELECRPNLAKCMTMAVSKGSSKALKTLVQLQGIYQQDPERKEALENQTIDNMMELLDAAIAKGNAQILATAADVAIPAILAHKEAGASTTDVVEASQTRLIMKAMALLDKKDADLLSAFLNSIMRHVPADKSQALSADLEKMALMKMYEAGTSRDEGVQIATKDMQAAIEAFKLRARLAQTEIEMVDAIDKKGQPVKERKIITDDVNYAEIKDSLFNLVVEDDAKAHRTGKKSGVLSYLELSTDEVHKLALVMGRMRDEAKAPGEHTQKKLTDEVLKALAEHLFGRSSKRARG
ncbi:MAG: hypothetical protein SFT92_01740 [Rickettsiales bacterium]|nr:hypothetical protein [Rickettsiales bacterium]